MKTIERVQWEGRITLPRRSPRIADGEEKAIHRLSGQAVRFDGAVEINHSIGRWPHAVHRRPPADGANRLGESACVFDQQLAVLFDGGWALLQHDDAPASFSNRRHRVAVCPMIFETVVRLRYHSCLEQGLVRGVGERFDETREVVHVREAVSDEQDVQSWSRRRIGNDESLR
jgi:hypothetical protein